MLDRLGIHPARLIVGVSPMDFTLLGVKRGREGLVRADSLLTNTMAASRGPAAWSRVALRACIHGSSPERKRNLGQWLELIRDRGSVLAFLNNEDATAPVRGGPADGYAAADRVASRKDFFQGEWGNIPGEYLGGHDALFARMAALIEHDRREGTNVILVRVPSSITVRRAEDRETSIDADLMRLSRTCGVSYIDGSSLMGRAFRKRSTQFLGRGAHEFRRRTALLAGARRGVDRPGQRSSEAGRGYSPVTTR